MTDDLHSLAPVYALDALEDLERRRFEEHLANCAACRHDVSQFRDTAALLVDAEVQPSAGMRDSVLAAIVTTPQVDPADLSSIEPTEGEPVESNRVGGLGATVAPLRSGGGAGDTREPSGRTTTPPASGGGGRGPEGWSAQQWFLGAAAALLVVAALAAVAVIADRTSGNDGADEVAIGAVEAVLEAPDAIHISMRSDDPTRASTDLEVVHSSGHNATVVVGDHVHGTAPDRVYQLWGVTPEGMVPAGVFEPTEAGTVEVPVGTPEGVEGWAVTVEPAGGSPAPSGDPVFTSEA